MTSLSSQQEFRLTYSRIISARTSRCQTNAKTPKSSPKTASFALNLYAVLLPVQHPTLNFVQSFCSIGYTTCVLYLKFSGVVKTLKIKLLFTVLKQLFFYFLSLFTICVTTCMICIHSISNLHQEKIQEYEFTAGAKQK